MPVFVSVASKDYHHELFETELHLITGDLKVGKLFGFNYVIRKEINGDMFVVVETDNITPLQRTQIQSAFTAHDHTLAPPPEKSDREEIVAIKSRLDTLEGR